MAETKSDGTIQQGRDIISADRAADGDGRNDVVLEHLMDRPGFLLRRCLQETGFAFEAACADLGITPRQFDFLFVLDMVEETSQDQLARVLGLDRSTCGLVLGILERKKFVERRVLASDKRKRQVRITEKGKAVYTSAVPAGEVAKQKLFDPLSSRERKMLMDLLRKVIKAYV